MDATQLRHLELLSNTFPNKKTVCAQIIALQSAQELPKPPEYFCSDIHGEYEAFSHILRNGSGAIRHMLDDIFGATLSTDEKNQLATLIYYPREKVKQLEGNRENREAKTAFYTTTVTQLICVYRHVARIYTHASVREILPQELTPILEELLDANNENTDKRRYYATLIEAAIKTEQAGAIVEALAHLIQRLVVGRLHVVGDIYDRGPYPDKIMEALMQFPTIDIQWGNHDIVWMGAALGQRGCIAHVVRNCARYGNLNILEDSYGINIRPLAAFATQVYAADPCVGFALKGSPVLEEAELELSVKIQKAMAIIQFKVEAALIDENPDFNLTDRKLLDKIDYERGTVMLDSTEYELTDKVFPTVDPACPFALTPEEEAVMLSLEKAFVNCEKLQRHMRFFLDAGHLYTIYNNNLLFHASVPLNPDGSLMQVNVFGKMFSGRALYDECERWIRRAFESPEAEERRRGRDLLWWMWLGSGSPLFAKSKMATFELYLIAEKEARKEVKNSFYSLQDNSVAMGRIFNDFGLDLENSHIICGHVPVKVKDGEDPIRCDGHVFNIDGGFSSAYQPTTGIAGYTLVSNSRELALIAHEPLESTQAAIENNVDIRSTKRVAERYDNYRRVADTDIGRAFAAQLEDLRALYAAYNEGLIAEKKSPDA